MMTTGSPVGTEWRSKSRFGEEHQQLGRRPSLGVDNAASFGEQFVIRHAC
jgi:hypothetical protein